MGGDGNQKEELKTEINEGGAWWRMATRDMEQLGILWCWFRDEVEKRSIEDREALKEFVKTLFTSARRQSPHDGNENTLFE